MASPTSTAPGSGNLKAGTLVPTAGETKSGFPPFEPATFSSQLIWLAITFGVLYFVLSRIALPRIGEVIEDRRDRIQRDLDEAERMKSETEKALAAYEASLADARGRAQGIAKDNRDQLTAEVERKRVEVEAENARKLEEAERRIAATKARALTQVSEIASDTAGSIVERLIGEQVRPEEVRQALGAHG